MCWVLVSKLPNRPAIVATILVMSHFAFGSFRTPELNINTYIICMLPGVREYFGDPDYPSAFLWVLQASCAGMIRISYYYNTALHHNYWKWAFCFVIVFNITVDSSVWILFWSRTKALLDYLAINNTFYHQNNKGNQIKPVTMHIDKFDWHLHFENSSLNLFYCSL